MKKETEKLITEIAKFIDKDKYNLILTSREYDKYLENILRVLVMKTIELEKQK